MCGLGGIVRVTPAGPGLMPPSVAIPEAWLDALDEAIRHRGPDGQGRFRDRAVTPSGHVMDVALVHRRLAIIDPQTGAQPMVWRGPGSACVSAAHAPATGTPTPPPGPEHVVAVVFNGCIYNHRALRAELEQGGARFVSDHSDTEVLVHGWRRWHENLPRHLDGMFALAVWSRHEGLILARDRAGEKPLFHTRALPFPGVAFASTPAALLRLLRRAGREPPTIDHGRLAWWLRLGFGPATPLRQIEALPPGTLARLTPAGELLLSRYDVADNVQRGVSPSPAEIEALLRKAVHDRLEADVPLGCFLSGGVDSSLIACLAQEELRRRGQRLRTFTVRMPEARYDESGFAARVARHIGSEHVVLEARGHAASDLVALIEGHGVPLGDSSLLPMHWVCRAARSEVAVALSGDGGDELFCGYERHVIEPVLRWLGPVLRAIPPQMVPQAHPRTRRAKLRRLLTAARGQGYLDLVAVFPRDLLARLLPGDLPPEPTVPDGRTFDLTRYLPEDLLSKTDMASMAVALEVRAPFLARDLLAKMQAVPRRVLMPRGQRKGLLRQIARRHLPKAAVDRPKMGFAIPLSEWFRQATPLRDLLGDHLTAVEPFGPPWLGLHLDVREARRLLEEHVSGRDDHAARLFLLLVLSIWARSLVRL